MPNSNAPQEGIKVELEDCLPQMAGLTYKPYKGFDINFRQGHSIHYILHISFKVPKYWHIILIHEVILMQATMSLLSSGQIETRFGLSG